MALSDAETSFVNSIMGSVPSELGCYVYHVANHSDPRAARNYFNSHEIENQVGITTVYRPHEELSARLFVIVLTEDADTTPTIPAEATDLVAGLGD